LAENSQVTAVKHQQSERKNIQLPMIGLTNPTLKNYVPDKFNAA